MKGKNFDRGVRVIITQPLSVFEGKHGTILGPTGAGSLNIAGIMYYFTESFLIYIDNYGYLDNYLAPIVFPPEFLEYEEPNIRAEEKISWDQFSIVMGSLGEFELANNIKLGSSLL